MKKQMKKLVGIPAMRVHLAAVNSHRMARGVYAVLGVPVAQRARKLAYVRESVCAASDLHEQTTKISSKN